MPNKLEFNQSFIHTHASTRKHSFTNNNFIVFRTFTQSSNCVRVVFAHSSPKQNLSKVTFTYTTYFTLSHFNKLSGLQLANRIRSPNRQTTFYTNAITRHYVSIGGLHPRCSIYDHSGCSWSLSPHTSSAVGCLFQAKTPRHPSPPGPRVRATRKRRRKSRSSSSL